MKTIAVCLVLAFAFGAVAANLADTVKSCGDGIPTPDEIYVVNCTEVPCEVRNGDTVVFTIVFVPRKSIRILVQRINTNTYSLSPQPATRRL